MNNVKNSIGWADYTWNPVVGCKRGCQWCYARRIHERFSNIPFSELQYFDERLEQPLKIKKPSRIFVGSMSDVCYWSLAYLNYVIEIIKKCPQHKFMFLTKELHFYINSPLQEIKNCWLGYTLTGNEPLSQHNHLARPEKCHAEIGFVSIEPLLSMPSLPNFKNVMDWIIVGGLSPNPVHAKEWVDKIIDYARDRKIPIFLKNNLRYPEVIKEYPKPGYPNEKVR